MNEIAVIRNGQCRVWWLRWLGGVRAWRRRLQPDPGDGHQPIRAAGEGRGQDVAVIGIWQVDLVGQMLILCGQTVQHAGVEQRRKHRCPSVAEADILRLLDQFIERPKTSFLRAALVGHQVCMAEKGSWNPDSAG